MSATTPYRILMVDDEPNVLAAYRRTTGRNFELTCAESGRAALALLDPARPFAVIVSDMRMAEMNGLDFIVAARAKSRDSVFMMLTGNADQQTAIDAINKGQIFRFLNKPCSPENLDTALNAAIRQHELVTAERALVRDTVAGSVKLLIDALEIACPVAFGLQSAIKRNQQQVTAGLGATPDWQLGLAATLCLVGLVAIPQLKPEEALTDQNLALASAIGGKLLGNIPRLQPPAKMIQRQRDEGMLPEDLASSDPKIIEEIGARVLRFSIDLAREEKRSGSRETAVAVLMNARRYDGRLFTALAKSPAAERVAGVVPTPAPPVTPPTPAMVKTADVRPGMVMARDLVLTNGKVFLAKGQTVSDVSAMMLEEYAGLGLVTATVEILRAA